MTTLLSKSQSHNRLINEKSPYLLQHADNPVDWYAWGPEAFAKARKEDKPIFLSIGYSTCHWCHVMEHESFEDAEVAKLMNEVFVSIKVDREERPDIDNVYMAVCQMMTGSGGWPLTIIMTPDKKPFFAATYIPKETRFGRLGMLKLIPRIQELWQTRRDEVLASAEKITTFLQRPSPVVSGESPGVEIFEKAYDQLTGRFDPRYGGFGSAPKFPTPHNLLFLLRYWQRSGNDRALKMVEQTLDAMRMGGIYDHVGFGFHRYSTDRKWLVPHFEKMLYDQALLATAYIEAYQATGKAEFADTARQIFTYVLRDMTGPQGGFYSAQDADSEGQEGKFYLWTKSQIRSVLNKAQADLVVRVFNVESGGNFVDQTVGRKTGENILHLDRSIDQIATQLKLSREDLQRRLERARAKLFAARQRRVHVYKDDKILADWNGLMIAALARGAQVLDEPKYAAAAKRSADFVLDKMRGPDGRLLHRYRDGQIAVPGNLDDYAFMIDGLIELYEATFDVRWLREAIGLNRDMIRDFWDDRAGGFYFTADDAERLLVRRKEIYDGAVPSGNSVAMLDLLRLSRMTAESEFEKMADALARAFAAELKQTPSAYTQMMIAIDFAIGPSYEIVIAGKLEAADTQAMLKALRGRFVTNKVVLYRPAGDEEPEITRIAPFTKYQTSIAGQATAYVCLNYQCKLPTTDIEKMLKAILPAAGPRR